ncbi:MAG TPA: 6-pyruvoyl-tetrahydropterin synthase-related protein, partial [Anaerolineae bacterium]
MQPSRTTILQRLSQIVWLDFGLLLALVLPIFAIMPLLAHAGLPNTADGPVHLMRQVELNEAWQEGNFYPRWGTDLAMGHGMPIFSYAPPALYQLTQLFHGAGLPLDEAMKAVLIVDFLLYSAGMFLFARRLYGTGPALLAAALYVYAPYRLREATIQGNYGQFTGLTFYPLIFWAFHGLITDGRPRYLIAAALSLAGLLFSHNISAMLFAPMFTSYLVGLFLLTAFQTNHRSNLDPPNIPPPPSHIPYPLSHIPYSTLLRITASGLLGLGLAAIFWLPAFGERHDIKLEGIVQGFFDFRENFISLPEFLSPPLPLDLTAINPEFPLSLGLPQIIGAGLGLVSLVILAITSLKWSLKKSQDQPGETIVPASTLLHSLFFAFFLLLYAFLAIPQSQSVWEAVPLLELTEFPWRMLGPAIFCASLLAATPVWLLARFWTDRATAPGTSSDLTFQVSGLHPGLLFRIILLSTILLTIGLNTPYLYPAQFIVWGTPTPAEAFAYEITSGAIGTTSTGEFLPRGAQQHPQPETLWPDYAAGRPLQIIDPATLPADANVKTISHRAESDTVQIETPTAFSATIRTLYWPGWQVYLNEQPVDFSVTDKTGLIQTTIPAGQHTLDVRLETTPLRTLGRWLTLLSAFSLAIIGILAVIRRRSSVVHQQDSAMRESQQIQTVSSFGISPGFLATTGMILIAAYLLSRPLEPLFVWRSDPNRPRPAARVLQVDFEDQIRLVGVDTWPETIRLDQNGTIDLSITVFWRALQELETNYSIFLHL